MVGYQRAATVRSKRFRRFARPFRGPEPILHRAQALAFAAALPAVEASSPPKPYRNSARGHAMSPRSPRGVGDGNLLSTGA